MTLAKALMVLLVAGAMAAWAPVGARAASDEDILEDTMIQWGDYDTFVVTDKKGGARSCAEACRRDPRCNAWTFIKAVRQCRLKHDAGPVVENKCCVSGYSKGEDDDKGKDKGKGGRQAFCADYADEAVKAFGQARSQDCEIDGPRWSDDYNTHYAWCLRTKRDAVEEETASRGDELKRCLETVKSGAGDKCEHYVRISMIQVETARKAKCGFDDEDGGGRWSSDKSRHAKLCQRAPDRAIEREIPEREEALARCFEAAGRSEKACGDYASGAVKQYNEAIQNNCEFDDPGRWHSSRIRHYQWCLDSAEPARVAETEMRSKAIEMCVKRAAQRKTCKEYADAAVADAIKADKLDCRLRGPRWSRYIDDHIDFCMSADGGEIKTEAAARRKDIERCERDKEDVVDPACDVYAKRAVRASEIYQQQNCESLDASLWSTKYRRHYETCIESNYGQRQDMQIARRRALRQCAYSQGFELQLEF